LDRLVRLDTDRNAPLSRDDALFFDIGNNPLAFSDFPVCSSALKFLHSFGV